MKKQLLPFFLAFFCLTTLLFGQKITIDRNNPERKEWFSDLGFGMLITWSIDVQLGAMISDNLAVSSKAYQDFYFTELPKTFNPKHFAPDEWASLASLAGAKYVVITAKHHNGFCMWDTQTSDFNIINSGYGKDMLKAIIDAFRKKGIAIGISFSPDDYFVMYRQGYPPSRESDESESTRNSALWEINKKQLRELLTNYGKIDILSIEENSDWANPLVANYAWDLDPNLIITHSGMETTAQSLPEKILESPWEARYTMGYDWQYGSEDKYKETGTILNLLIETRAKGGNFLLNIGPDASGEIPEEQESRLREIGLWNMANNEAISTVKPWKTCNEQDIWFTTSKDEKVIYAFVKAPYWKWMEEKAFFIRSIKGSTNTQVSVLSQNDLMMEYQVHRSPKPVFSLNEDGIFVNVIKAQRMNKSLDYPLVIKFEGIAYREEIRK